MALPGEAKVQFNVVLAKSLGELSIGSITETIATVTKIH